MGKKYGILIICAVILFLCFVGTSSAETWYVDDDGGADFTRIQDAISAASAGDTIIVKPGKYTEHVVVDEQLTLKGEGYPVVDGEGTGTVIWIRADGVHIEGFKVMRCDPAQENNDEGIEVWTNNCVIDNCIISDCNIGLGSGGNDNVITNCRFNDNRIGLVIGNGERNTAKKNHFRNGSIILDNAKNNLIANNIVELDSGISIYNDCEYNTIKGNTIKSNSMCAIAIRKSKWGPTSHNNKIYHNNFIDNGWDYQAYDDGNNQWDNGAEGNYWSDYREKYPGAEEIDESGIWDKPYDNIGDFETRQKSGAKDKYPLVEPWEPGEEEELEPTIELIHSSHDFGEIYTTISSLPYEFTLTNVGGETATGTVYLTDNDADQFIITTSGGRSFSLASGETKAIGVAFGPTSAGSKSAILYVEGSNCNDVQSSLSGTGIIETLQVPYEYVDGTEWCGPASTAMVLKYYGKKVHMWDIAEALKLGNDEGTKMSELFEYIKNNYPELSINEGDDDPNVDDGEYIKWGIPWRMDDFKDYLVSELMDDKNPVILRIGKITHAVVLVGVSTEDPSDPTFYVNDPGIALLKEIGVDVSKVVPIKYPVKWSQIEQFRFGGFNTISVQGTPNPPNGSLSNVYFNVEEAASDVFIANRSYNAGLKWKWNGSGLEYPVDDYSASFKSTHFFHIDALIANHMDSSQTYICQFVTLSGKILEAPESISIKPRHGDYYAAMSGIFQDMGLSGKTALYIELYDSENNLLDEIGPIKFKVI